MTSGHELIKEFNVDVKLGKLRGIYAIYCISDDKLYIGQSKNIKERWKAHKRELKKNSHGNVYLQRAWNKYKETAFSFHVILLSDETTLNYIEAEFLNKLPKERYFNMLDPLKGQEYTEETARKISKNRYKKASAETVERLRSYNANRVVSEETKELHRAQTLGEKNPFFGKKHSEESKKKMSLKRQMMRGTIIKKRTLTDVQANQVRQDYINGKSMTKLSKEYNLAEGTIRCICIGESYICGAEIDKNLILLSKNRLIKRKRS